MAIQPVQNTSDAILQRIDAMIEELRSLRQAVLTMGQKDNIAPPKPTMKRSVLEILANAPEQSYFPSTQAVDHYIAEERASWDS